ncbi:ABC transporter ATP-binding protein [Phocaeicola abscessus]|uniref:ABC transporter ATP-binding protein n=1 Tax=Phocaeicola abscessus TaxID=555313 RepID=UPI0003866081|nr:ABC transporter ATP-binding protein [Phocaeicola abscessus]EPT33794.1 ABC transporter, ATP-binding protein [Bacteroidetes bacterium oral taxon 272 str. F0290]
MISIQNLNKYYGRLQVLQEVNLELNDGECIAFIGPNGCGKTTLMKCILGLVTPTSGHVVVNGQDVQDNPQSRSEIGFMPQKSSFPENMTVGQTIETLCTVRGYKGRLDEELYHRFAIPSIAGKRMNTLSGGTGQKVNAAVAFLFDPMIFILDEPAASLDPLAAEILKEKIRKEKQKGKLIFITSHILSELEDLATHIVFMEEGRIILYKSVEELQKETGESTVTQSIMRILNDNEINR